MLLLPISSLPMSLLPSSLQFQISSARHENSFIIIIITKLLSQSHAYPPCSSLYNPSPLFCPSLLLLPYFSSPPLNFPLLSSSLNSSPFLFSFLLFSSLLFSSLLLSSLLFSTILYYSLLSSPLLFSRLLLSPPLIFLYFLLHPSDHCIAPHLIEIQPATLRYASEYRFF